MLQLEDDSLVPPELRAGYRIQRTRAIYPLNYNKGKMH